MSGENKGSLRIRNFVGCTGSGAEPITLEEVKARLRALRPGPIGNAGEAYLVAAKALSEASRRLHRHAEVLAEHWKGDAAQGALKQLGQLNTTACELANKIQQTGSTAKWLSGNSMLGWYKHQGDVIGDGFIRSSGDDENARKILAALSHRYNEANMSMPESVSKDLPLADNRGGRGGLDTAPSASTARPSAMGAARVQDGSQGPEIRPFHDNYSGESPPTEGGVGFGHSASDSNVGTDLAGLPRGLESTGAGAPDAYSPSNVDLGQNGLGIVGQSADPLGNSVDANGVRMPRQRPEFDAGRPIEGSPSTSQQRSNVGAPVAGQSRDEDERERDRCYWLTEDEEIWGACNDVAPPVIE
jgi:hypothetical protein